MQEIAEQFVQVAEEVGVLLKGMQHPYLASQYKAPGDLVTEADLRSHELLSRELRDRFPGYDLILEEADNPTILPSDFVVADELDGTVVYANGLSEWGISIACVKAGTPVVGVMHQPSRNVTVAAWRGGGTWIGDRRATLSGTQSLADSISLVELNRHLNAEHMAWIQEVSRRSLATRSLGTVIGSAIELLSGHAVVYLNCKGAKVWDLAAAVVCVEEAGGVAKACDGSDLNWRQIPMSVLLAANSHTATEVLSLAFRR